MLKTIVRKEILENVSSYRFPLFMALCALLIPLGMYVNHLDFNKRVRDYSEQVRLSQEAAAAMQMQDVMAGAATLKGFRRPSALSVFAQGYENALPKYYEFTQEGYKAGESSIGDESVLSVLGKIDFVFLIQMILSLIGMLFASDVITGEKESGTLRAMLSNRLPRDSVLIGKILGGWFALWIPFTAAFLIGLAVLGLTGFPLFTGDTPARVLTIFLSSSLFLLIYFSIGAAVSAATGRTRASQVLVLLIWVSFQLVIPKLSDMTAALIHPIRTETQVSLEKSLIAKSLDYEMSKELGVRNELIYGRDERASDSDRQSALDKKWADAEKEIKKKYRERKAEQIGRIDGAFNRELLVRRRIATGLSLISPSAAFTRLLSDVCGTGEIEKTKYVDAVKVHQQVLYDAVFSKAERTSIIRPDGKTSLAFSIGDIDTKTLPGFSMTSASLGEVFKGSWINLISLIFWLIVPFAVAYVAFLKYDVR